MVERDNRKGEVIHVTILASSHALRAGLRLMLAAGQGIEVIADAPAFSGLESSPAESDVIVTTFAPLHAELEKALPGLEVYPALLLLCDDPEDVKGVLDLPVRAWGALPLDASAEELAAAVQALHEGMLVGAPHLLLPGLQASGSKFPVEGIPGLSPDSLPYQVQPSSLELQPEAADLLTPREAEVLALLAQGMANKQIAVALAISEHTVKFHVSSIYAKLGVGNRTEAVRAGARRGLILL
jgi:DNA-binding NarL/FixJ family response regulator